MRATTDTNPAATIVPDAASTASKKDQVAEMFNNIAGKYDFLNHFLSMGIDRTWRKKAIREIKAANPATILDVATGTGDMAIAAARAIAGVKVIGVDIAEQMMAEGRKKTDVQGLTGTITFQYADSESLPFPTGSFDAMMCAYGVRNFEHLEAGLTEMHRVLAPGGRLVILEFSRPTAFPIKQLYQSSFKYFCPLIGRMVSRHSRAYDYLHDSANAFPDGQRFCDILTGCGYKQARARKLTFGVTTLYTAIK